MRFEVTCRRAAPEHDERRKSACGSTPRASPSCRSAIRRRLPRRLRAGAVGPWRQPAGQRPAGLRRPAPTSRQTVCVLRSNNFMIDGQDANNPQRRRLAATAEQPRHRRRVPADHKSVRTGVRARCRIGGQHRHQERHERVPWHPAFWLSQQQQVQLPEQSRQGGALHGGALYRDREPVLGATFGGPVIKEKTFFFVSAAALDRPPPRLRVDDQRRADGRGPPAAPVNWPARRLRWQALLENLSPAAQTARPRPAATLLTRRPDFLRFRLEIITSSGIAGFQQLAVLGARRSPAVGESPADRRAIMVNTTPDNSGSGQVTPPGLTTGGDVEPALAQHLAEQRASGRTCRTSSAWRGHTWAPTPARRTRPSRDDPVARDHLRSA